MPEEDVLRDHRCSTFPTRPSRAVIRSAKKRGYVTHDQINALLSSGEVKSEQIEDILAKFSEMGINVVETTEAEPEEEVATREEPRTKPRTRTS